MIAGETVEYAAKTGHANIITAMGLLFSSWEGNLNCTKEYEKFSALGIGLCTAFHTTPTKMPKSTVLNLYKILFSR